LSSLTVDVNYGPELKEWTDGDIATDWAFGFMNGYSIDSRAIGDDSYRLMAIAPNVKPGVTEGWDVKDSWQKIATLRWNIAKATSVEISIDDGTNTAAYFENHQNNPEGNAIGWSVSNYDLGQTPLPIELSSFDATYDCDGCVVLNWTTQTEFNNAGFHVYRSTDKDGGYNLLNEKLVESTGNYTYKYIDDTVDTNVDTYYYYLEDVDLDGVKSRSQIIKVTRSEVTFVPEKFALLQNYPNPYNPETWIPYMLPVNTDVTIKIYNPTGNIVKTLSLGEREAGMYVSKDRAAYWDGKNEAGEQIGSGVYFYAIEAGDFRAVKKMIILK
jgi:hypothetical protein